MRCEYAFRLKKSEYTKIPFMFSYYFKIHNEKAN